jgi:hypothetical protein
LKVVTARLAEMVKNSATLDINRTGQSVKALATAGNPRVVGAIIGTSRIPVQASAAGM